MTRPSTTDVCSWNILLLRTEILLKDSIQEQRGGAPLQADSQFATVAEAPPPDLSEVTMRETLSPYTQAHNSGEGVIAGSKHATPIATQEVFDSENI